MSIVSIGDILIKDTFEIVTPSIRVRAISSDPQDNHVIEAALTARANYTISGEKHLLELMKLEDIRVVSPAQFMQTVIGQQSA